MLKKIISGGQTGADRAALDAGLRHEFPIGGFCPKDRLAEDGCIDAIYPLIELTGGYRQRTRANVDSADATVIFFESTISGGTALTWRHCVKRQKPHILIDISSTHHGEAVHMIQDFVAEFEIETLNIAGPRASGCARIYAYVDAVLSRFIEAAKT